MIASVGHGMLSPSCLNSGSNFGNHEHRQHAIAAAITHMTISG
jgi:hypothetical protein